MLISFFGLLGQSALSQTNNPVVPEADYVVYTIVANKFSGCANKKQAHLRNHLLMFSTTTKIQDTYSFQFDFTKAQEDLPFMVKSQNHFFKNPIGRPSLHQLKRTYLASMNLLTRLN